MTKNEASFFRDLAAHLATLYGSEQAQRVMDDAGLDWRNVDLTGSARVVWGNVVTEARKSNRGLVSLFQVAIKDYPDNTRLVNELFVEMPTVDSVGIGIERLSQQIADLQNQNTEANKRTEAIDRKLSALTLQVSGISQQVAGLSAQVVNQGA